VLGNARVPFESCKKCSRVNWVASGPYRTTNPDDVTDKFVAIQPEIRSLRC
jgi:hypothetical protein